VIQTQAVRGIGEASAERFGAKPEERIDAGLPATSGKRSITPDENCNDCAAGHTTGVPLAQRNLKFGSLRDLLDFTGTNAGGADPDAAPGSVDQGPNRLQVQVPTAIRDIVRVTDAVPKLGAAIT